MLISRMKNEKAGSLEVGSTRTIILKKGLLLTSSPNNKFNKKYHRIENIYYFYIQRHICIKFITRVLLLETKIIIIIKFKNSWSDLFGCWAAIVAIEFFLYIFFIHYHTVYIISSLNAYAF